MAKFEYKVRDSKGHLMTGKIDAPSIDDAGKKLRAEGKFIVHLNPLSGADSIDEDARISPQKAAKHVKRDEVISFCHQLAVMVDTGVPLREALDCAIDHTQSPHFKAVLEDVNDRVQSGSDFSSSLGQYPRVFPTVMISLVQASEVSGKMGEMLDRISQYLSKEQLTRKKIKGALIYPAFMLGMCVVITIALLVFVLPRFATIYAGRGAALPGPTRILLTTSDLLVNHWMYWLGGTFAVLIALYVFFRSNQGRRCLDYLKLHTPVIGGLFSKLYITRACSTMGTLISSGVAILDMVDIVRKVTENVYYEDLWNKVDERLREGLQLSDPLFKSALIPRSVAQMIFSGEKSGRLGMVLNRIAAYTEEELDDAIKTATQFIEPIMIVSMGLLIGFIAMALLLPVFNVSRVVAGG